MYHIPEDLIKTQTYFSDVSSLSLNKQALINEFIEGLYKDAERMQDVFPDKRLGAELEAIYRNSDVYLGIHRTDLDFQTIFQSGIKMRDNEYDSNISVYGYFPQYLSEILKAESYKCSVGIVIVVLPRITSKPIYFVDRNRNYLLPEYIWGYIALQEQKIVDVIRNPRYSENHQYEPDGLSFDSKLTK